MEVCALASGSSGNCIAVRGGGTALLVDIGLSCCDTVRRLRAAELDPAEISSVIFTHNHSDHYKGAATFSKRYPVQLFANSGTAEGIDLELHKSLEWTIFETNQTFEIGGLSVEAFSVPHDAADPVGFVITENGRRLFLATDLGQSPGLVQLRLRESHVAVLESNHDFTMQMQSDRPTSLKRRIIGPSGHLSNDQCADLLMAANPPGLHTLMLAHLSCDCNTPALALQSMRWALEKIRRPEIRTIALSPSEPSPWVTV